MKEKNCDFCDDKAQILDLKVTTTKFFCLKHVPADLKHPKNAQKWMKYVHNARLKKKLCFLCGKPSLAHGSQVVLPRYSCEDCVE